MRIPFVDTLWISQPILLRCTHMLLWWPLVSDISSACVSTWKRFVRTTPYNWTKSIRWFCRTKNAARLESDRKWSRTSNFMSRSLGKCIFDLVLVFEWREKASAEEIYVISPFCRFYKRYSGLIGGMIFFQTVSGSVFVSTTIFLLYAVSKRWLNLTRNSNNHLYWIS